MPTPIGWWISWNTGSAAWNAVSASAKRPCAA